MRNAHARLPGYTLSTPINRIYFISWHAITSLLQSDGSFRQHCLDSYNTAHFGPEPGRFFFLLMACCVAVSKIFLTPSLVFAEHSRYPWAPILKAMACPSSNDTGSCLIVRRSLIVWGSFLESKITWSKLSTRVSNHHKLPEIFLIPYKKYRHIRAKMFNLGDPFLWNVLKRIRRINGKTHQNNISVGIRQWS